MTRALGRIFVSKVRLH